MNSEEKLFIENLLKHERISKKEVDGNVFFKKLLREKILISENYDEKEQYLKSITNSTSFANKTVSLTILPTINCNLSCPYCFEKLDGKKGKMGVTVQKDIINHLERIPEPFDKVTITWYGGEPTLAINTVKSLSKEIQEFCLKKQQSCFIFYCY
ncbi:MAG: radical SAM protein [Mangrovibacterium sp.]